MPESLPSPIGTARRSRMHSYIAAQGSATIAELKLRFDVSPVTVHRDLLKLEEEGLIDRVRGGAKVIDLNRRGSLRDWDARQLQRAAAKQEIARICLGQIATGSTIFLDASTTAYALACLLQEEPLPALTIVTNSPAIISEVTLDAHIIACPGEVDQHINNIAGRWTEDFFSKINISVCFLGGAAIDLQHGLSSTQRRTADVNRAASTVSSRVIVMTDATKFDKTALVTTLPIDRIDTVITDSNLPSETAERYRAHGITLLPESL